MSFKKFNRGFDLKCSKGGIEAVLGRRFSKTFLLKSKDPKKRFDKDKERLSRNYVGIKN